MRILFWNVRGLGKAHRRRWVKEHILSEDIDMVAIQKTIKQDFSDIELKEMAGDRDFSWLWIPSRGHSGGMLSGIKSEEYEIESSFKGLYSLGLLIRNRVNNYRFWILNVYGPAQHELLGDFIAEIQDFCAKETCPILLGGL